MVAFFQAKMSNICWFQRLKCHNLLLVIIIYDSKWRETNNNNRITTNPDLLCGTDNKCHITWIFKYSLQQNWSCQSQETEEKYFLLECLFQYKCEHVFKKCESIPKHPAVSMVGDSDGQTLIPLGYCTVSHLSILTLASRVFECLWLTFRSAVKIQFKDLEKMLNILDNKLISLRNS